VCFGLCHVVSLGFHQCPDSAARDPPPVPIRGCIRVVSRARAADAWDFSNRSQVTRVRGLANPRSISSVTVRSRRAARAGFLRTPPNWPEQRTFLRRFVQATGMRPSEYQQRLRISRAREMLEFTRTSVDNIALSVGCEDVGGFRRVFRKIVGLTPSDYRRRFSRRGRAAMTLATDAAQTR
jgi:hypothetical protein